MILAKAKVAAASRFAWIDLKFKIDLGEEYMMTMDNTKGEIELHH
jgi:hypothetical protein